MTGDFGLQGWLTDRFGVRGGALYVFFGSLLAIAVSGCASWLLGQPLLFPSLGPTAFLFFEAPLAENASPRNTIIGHAVAILAGVLSLWVFGLLNAPDVLQAGVSPARTGAAALSVALTGAVLMLFHSSHPPAGATTLIVSLGFFESPHTLLMLALGVLLLTATGWTLNRALGAPVPLWKPRKQERGGNKNER